MSIKISELKKMCDWLLQEYGDGEVGSLYIGKKGDKFYDPINDCNFSPEEKKFILITNKNEKDKKVDSKHIIKLKEQLKINN